MHSRDVMPRAARHIESVGMIVAKRVLAEATPKFQYGLSVVPVEQLASSFGVAITAGDSPLDDSLASMKDLGLDGLARRVPDESGPDTSANWFGSDYAIQILSRGVRSRFTLAHEIAHVVLSKEYADLDKALSLDERERVCDVAAGNILCPYEALLEHFRTRTLAALTIPEIEQLSARMRISISLLVNRLRQLFSRNTLSLDGVAILVRLARSRKRQENLAPRVASACSPGRWFVPLNARLSTLGLSALQDAFYEAPLYISGHTREVLRLWDYEVGRRIDIPCDVKFKCYRWIGPKPSTSIAEYRLMLAVANCERS